MKLMPEANQDAACTKRRYEVSHTDLPVCCPPADLRVWDAHPRVYLPIAEAGVAVCPYCEAEFVLKADARNDS